MLIEGNLEEEMCLPGALEDYFERITFQKYFPAVVSFPNNRCLIQFVAPFSFPEGKLSTDGSLRLMYVISWFGLSFY